ncbi:MAG: nucleotide sugar dehydrogenase [Lachnospirales bacterium]
MIKNVCVLGLGYIGLPTSAMFASSGVKTYGVDVNQNVIDSLKKGEIIIEESGLPELVKEVVDKGYLECGTTPIVSDVYIIAVPTPVREDKTAGMEYVESATKSILPIIKKGDLVVLESTSPPRTTEDIIVPILKNSGLDIGKDVFVSHSPERVLPGQILNELVNNNRIVGGINEESSLKTKELYEIFVKGDIFITDATTAEMCKLMENTYRDVNIALANELAKISEKLKINAFDVVKYANMHPRVNLHTPGPGVGGHCIAVDPWFIIEKAPEVTSLMEASRTINDGMPKYVANKALDILKDKKNVTVLGITYKPDVDDMRESPIVHLIEELENEGVNVKVVDPHVSKYDIPLYENIENSDLLILAVNHKEFKDLDFIKIYEAMNSKNILDTRNYYNRESLEKIGFNYTLLGDGGHFE